jgi:AbrB family looped-hinge helix DNA binding protein
MTVTIDKAGRVVVPKPVRDRLGLHAGLELELTEVRDGLLLKTSAREPSLVEIEGVWVHQGKPQGRFDASALIHQEREDRIRHLMDL